ncbi:toxin-antitoxin system, toxin component, GNAT domain protein [Leptospira kirschneri str. 2008720114]|nr:toxin-antitoxin system, toxin component, GNAT domain protein [Leptospira kirschneri str. 2008720114]
MSANFSEFQNRFLNLNCKRLSLEKFKMNIKEASILDLPEIAKLFDEYRQFYKQKSDLKGAENLSKKEFLNKNLKFIF